MTVISVGTTADPGSVKVWQSVTGHYILWEGDIMELQTHTAVSQA